MEARGKADPGAGAEDILGGATEASELQSAPSAATSPGGTTTTLQDIRKSFDQALSDMQPMAKDYWQDAGDGPGKAPTETVEATEENLRAKLKEIQQGKAQKRKEDKAAKAEERAAAVAAKVKAGAKPPKEKTEEASVSSLMTSSSCRLS